MFEYLMNNPILIFLTITVLFLIVIIIFKRLKSKTSIDFNMIKDLETFNEFLKPYGYIYDPHRDIFYTHINAWQRDMGYTRLYDEAAAPTSMIIDCEPIYFEYNNKRWLIEFWVHRGRFFLH